MERGSGRKQWEEGARGGSGRRGSKSKNWSRKCVAYAMRIGSRNPVKIWKLDASEEVDEGNMSRL